MIQNPQSLPLGVPADLYPFTSHVLDRNGIGYHYVDEGQGDAVVMLHGNPTWSFYYRNLILELKGHYRTVVPDHVGMGLSDKPGDDVYDYRLASRVTDLEALLSHLGLDSGPKLTLVMHDWGGMIGMAFAARHPQRIGRLILMNTAAFHLPHDIRLPLALRAIRDTPLGAVAVRGFNAFARIAAHVAAVRPKMTPALRNAYCAPYNSWQSRIGTLRFVQDIPLKVGDPSYVTVTQAQEGLPLFASTPKMFVWGMKDFVFSPKVLEHWRKYWPNSEVQTFSDSGHYVLEDRAADVCAAIQDFLKRNPL